MAPAHGADNVVPDNEDSGGPPLPHWGYPMWASKRKKGTFDPGQLAVFKQNCLIFGHCLVQYKVYDQLL